MVGELGFQHGTPVRQVAFETILSESERRQTGYLPWSWTGNRGGVEDLDIVGDFGGALTQWGRDVIDGPDGIRQTAERSSTSGE